MIAASWRISTSHGGTRRWFWVRVHADLGHMRAACHRSRPWHGLQYWADAAAVCHTVSARYRDTDLEFTDPAYPANGYAGTIRLVADHITTEIVAHELVHAAAQVYRMNCRPVVDLGDGFDEDALPREEDFAYIYGELFSDMDSELTSRADKEPNRFLYDLGPVDTHRRRDRADDSGGAARGHRTAGPGPSRRRRRMACAAPPADGH